MASDPASGQRPAASRPLSRKLSRVRAWLRMNVVSVQTTSGRLMDAFFIGAVLVGVLALVLESVPRIEAAYGSTLKSVEIAVGTIFVVEYLIRLWVARRKLRYIRSFWGVVDLIAILPFFFQGFGLAYLRSFRILRVFTIFKVAKYTRAGDALLTSLLQSRTKIAVFLLTVFVLVLIQGFLMHQVEPETFKTVPEALWWTVVTLTTVGYGDLVPVTLLGKALASVTMVLAFGIIAVPTGIVAVEYDNALQEQGKELACTRCNKSHHQRDANYCAVCGERLPPEESSSSAARS